MMKKIVILMISAFLLFGCGTEYFYSSFYLRNSDLKWMLSPSQQGSLNYKSTVLGTGDFKFNSPSIIATPDNYILFLYERRGNDYSDIIGVNGDSSKRADVYAAVSKNAENFIYLTQLVGGSSLKSHGSPIAFVNNVNNNSEVIVLAVGGNGFANSQDDTPSVISKSVSVPKTEYAEWTEWEDLNTNIFEPLLKDNFNRFYTSPDSGITLRNGTLACIIDYKKKDEDRAKGFAILYSTDNGTNWKIGAKTTYKDHRFAKIIAERKDGKLLIAAAENSDNDYNKQADLAWFLADSLEGNITGFSPAGLPPHNCGSTAGGKIQLAAGGYSKEAIILLHSYTNRETINPNGVVNSVKNANALYISFNDGQNWEIVTNIFYPLKFNGKNYIYDDYDSKTSFRQSMRVLKDGTIAAVSENGNYVINTSGGADTGFRLVYRRFSLNAISGGKYRYEGL
ncbi:sialidase (neuraminidase) family protein-like protein [Brachyspira pilosicoli WesB]|uniref:Sialidase (Neuraminidase) family protein-like protein n=1 Tax=Brachyspira pilosicoli WesB TaxID=1161918 RepID=K0JHM6_BRAPL|nr:sialidase family protein [Brachyspira pilosicoli]CCG56394.1 sialidase (neuraminidase) family protein-like protein [Brachyspira pilosicoli WesB]